MKNKTNHLLEFLQQDYFHEKIYKSLFYFFAKNKDLIENRLDGDVSYITEIQELELDYKNVWIDDKEAMRIDFDIAISVDINVTARYGKHRDIDEFSARDVWVMLYCTGDLGKKLKDFKIIGVEEFNKSKPKKPLTGDMVPIIPASEYGKYANEILEKYYPEVLQLPMPVDVDELAKRMGLTVYNKSITEDRSLFGQIFFNETVVELYNRKEKKLKRVKVPANSIIVDKNVSYLYSFGSRNMTVVHECVHYVLHKKAFLFAQLFDKELNFIKCQVKGRFEQSDSQSSTYWMELQANAIAPYILMPEVTFKAMTEKLFKSYSHFNDWDPLDVIETIIRELADFFGVTIYAARKRLIDLGYEIALGACNWVDGKYVRPYRFKRNSLKPNETYTVNYIDVMDVLFQNSKIVEGIIAGNYVFVENHVCLNDNKYITNDLNDRVVLTEYARKHIDECCLKFTCKIKDLSQPTSFVTFCYLGRDCRHNFTFELNLPESENGEVIERAKYKPNMDEYMDGLKKMRLIASMTLPDAITYLMEMFDMSAHKLEIYSGVDERTIRRYANGENKKPNKQTLIAICRGMKLPLIISELLLSLGGITLTTNDRDDEMYRIILTGMLNQTPDEINEFLDNCGCTRLTQEKS